MTANLSSASSAVAAQAQKVQQLTQQEAVIETGKPELDALKQQLAEARENLAGIKKEAQAAL